MPVDPTAEDVMPRLFLLRHAKAAWAAPGMSDFDRPLTPEGMRAARATGRAMAAAGHKPALVLCSPALRTRQTWEGVAEAIGGGAQVEMPAPLYDGGAKAYLDAIRRAVDTASLLVVGHNPMTEDIGDALAGDGDADALAALKAGFPVCGLAVIRFDVLFAKVKRGMGRLESFSVEEG
jgi:phosphohistidine phosphatase